MKVKTKFFITLFATVIYIAICIALSRNWYHDISDVFNPIIAVFTIAGIAIFPAILCSVMCIGVVCDHEQEHPIYDELPDLNILIAAKDEEENIQNTIRSIINNHYNGKVIIKVIDNASTDHTREKILDMQDQYSEYDIQYIFEINPGKSKALNTALKDVNTEFFITLDADTVLAPNALNKIVSAMVLESKDKKIGAIAGSVFVRNSKASFMARMQFWDYFVSISSVKRYQGLFQSVLVAQGAFSIYRTDLIKRLGGWKDTIGEDIVLSWDILFNGYRIYYEPYSISYTNVPTTYRSLFRQRSRWARGMVEGLRQRNIFKYPTIYSKILVGMDYLLFIIDFNIVVVFVPSIIAALAFQNYLFVGKLTLLCIPMTILMFCILYRKERRVFKNTGEEIAEKIPFLGIFILVYQIIMSPASLVGYIEETFNLKRRWK